MKSKQAVLAGVILAAVVFQTTDLPGCGPFFPEAVFTDRVRPDSPLKDFARGRLGVLQPTYWRRYLVVAYRCLSGQPLSLVEQNAFAPAPAAAAEPGAAGSELSWASPAVKEWLDARGKVAGPGAPPRIEVYRRPKNSSWQSFVNCSDDAFRNARGTLETRIAAFGAAHPGIKAWVAAQDAVFANCHEGAAVPAEPKEPLPQVLKYDLEYQIAAAYFYAMNYDEAARRFREIAAEPESPHSRMASYLEARCLIRQATVPAQEGKVDLQLLAQAEQQLKTILQDNRLRDLHPRASRLTDFIALRLHPLEQVRMLANKLKDPAAASGFGQNLTDYEYLMDRAYSAPLSAGIHQTDDMTDWILTMQRQGKDDLDHALGKWEATGGSAWLLCAIGKISAGHPESSKVLAAAAKLTQDSPAFPTVQYHRIRLLLEAGKNDEARKTLDGILPGLRALPARSSLNLFLAQRMRLARNLEEFLQSAPRTVSRIENLWPGEGKPDPYLLAWFDRDSARVFNEAMSLPVLRRAIATKALPAHLRKQLILAAWVRAVLLSEDDTAGALAADLVLSYPELKPELQAWSSATGPESRQFAAAMLMMHFPGVSPFVQSGIPRRARLAGIDDFQENWWCGFGIGGDLDQPTRGRRSYLFEYDSGGPRRAAAKRRPEPAEFPQFLDSAEKAALLAEWGKLAEVETAPSYFGRIVISWAARNPGDARVPEALHLVVKATRYGCNDDGSGRYSRQAFELLHQKYPDSKWAKMTPYWYK